MTRKTALRRSVVVGVLGLAAVAAGIAAPPAEKPAKVWAVHDETRPQPKAVAPGRPGTQDRPAAPPADATVLFDGKDLSKWTDVGGGPAKWKVAGGCVEAAKGTGDIQTREAFGSCQLHLEFASPAPPQPGAKFPGNSGAFLMGLYEVQVLDSYRNTKAYADGQAGAIYGQAPPLVNPSRPAGQWQTFDIIFHRPRFDAAGKVLRAATITVLHNGVLVQDHFRIQGATAHKRRATYGRHADKLPLRLQQHGSAVRFRNIWVRPIADAE